MQTPTHIYTYTSNNYNTHDHSCTQALTNTQMIYMEEIKKGEEGDSHKVVTCGAPTEALAEATEDFDG